jgi:hypothetical protein
MCQLRALTALCQYCHSYPPQSGVLGTQRWKPSAPRSSAQTLCTERYPQAMPLSDDLGGSDFNTNVVRWLNGLKRHTR